MVTQSTYFYFDLLFYILIVVEAGDLENILAYILGKFKGFIYIIYHN